jgi:RNA polymerase primary sigma factor
VKPIQLPHRPGDSIESFARAAARTPLLTPAEERALGRRIAGGDDRARSHLVHANLRLVMAHARRYRGSNVPYADLVQEGVVGLIKAAGRFDAERGVHFATYASWSIRQAMSEAVRRAASPAYLPARDARRALQLRRAGGEGDDRLLHALAPAASLDADAPDGGAPLRDRLEDERAGDPFEDVARSATQATVRDRLRRLPAREAEVLRLRYALGGGDERSFAEIGARLGVSAERARQLERRALERLRTDPELAALREAA